MLLTKSSRITVKHRIFLTTHTTCLSLSLVHSKLLLFHSLQLGADAELGSLENWRCIKVLISSRKTLPSFGVWQTCSRTLKPSLVLAWCWGHISIQRPVKFCNTSDLTIWHLSGSDLIWTYNFPRRSFTAMFSSFIWRWKRLLYETPIILYWQNQYTAYLLGWLNI